MAITSSDIVDLLDANLGKFWQDGLEGWGNQYEKIFNVMNSDKQSESGSYESGFMAMPEKTEGSAATYDRIYAGIKETLIHKSYGLGYELTEEAVEDNQRTPESFNKLPQALSRSAEETVEITSANIFNNGFSTNGFDGTTLFSTSHTNLDGSTQANRPSTDADLSVTSLTAGLTTISKFTDERGLKRPTRAKMVVVSDDNWNVIEELLQSEYKPFVANNEVNALQMRELQGFVWHYLTDTDAWFILSSKEDHLLTFWWRRRLGALKRGNDFDSTNLKHLATMRFSVGYYHWKGLYGTNGA